MRLIPSNNGYLAVQAVQGPRGAVNAAGWGASRLEAMAACMDLAKGLEVGR